MKISVKVKPNSRQESVEKISEKEYLLRVRASAQEGKANQAVVKLLSEFFDIPKSTVIILKGASSKNKIIELLGRGE